MNQLLMEPVVQYGLAGVVAAQFALLFWLLKKLIKLLEDNQTLVAAQIKKNHELIADQTEATTNLNATIAELPKAVYLLKDKLISRPCIAKGEQGQ